LTVRGSGGVPVQRTLTVRVERPPEPEKSASIVRFEASPMRLKGSAQLCFTATNATTATIAPGNPQPTSPNGGCVARQASVTTTYTLTVRGNTGPAQQRRVVVEVPKPPTPAPQSDGPILKKPDAVIRKEIEVPKSDAPRIN